MVRSEGANKSTPSIWDLTLEHLEQYLTHKLRVDLSLGLLHDKAEGGWGKGQQNGSGLLVGWVTKRR